MASKRVAVIGASGYGGLQTLRLLQGHPSLEVSFLGGERSSGKRWSELTPFLPLPGDPVVQSPDPDAIAAAADLAVLSLPNGLASTLVPPLLERGVKVVDLSADYRYSSLEHWKEVYASEARSFPRTDADLCSEAVYGLVEWEAERIAAARLVAAPGCFPTASLLALTPLLKQGLIETSGIVIDAKTGTSGGGRAAKEHLLLAEASEGVAPYGVVGHRHTSEIEQLCSRASGHAIALQFTPHLIPMDRGILSTIYVRPAVGVTAKRALEVLRQAYAEEPFVRVTSELPATKDVSGTNYCDLTVRELGNRLVVVSVIDNLIKGAAGAAVQNLNVMCGYPETLGLL